MKPSELYKLPPIRVTGDNRKDFDTFPDFEGIFDVFFDDYSTHDKIRGLEVKYYVDYTHDGTRSAILCSWWFHGKPFMITRESGRGARIST